MKRCSRCAREIPESAATCGRCGDPSMALVLVKKVEAAPVDVSAPQPASPPVIPVAPVVPLASMVPAVHVVPAAPVIPATPVKARTVSRPMLVAVLLIVAGGSLAFAMLRTSAPPAVRVVVPATPKPAASNAPKPVAPPAANAATAAAIAPAVAPMWKTANEEWLLNARRGAAFELPSRNKVTVWQGITQPMLVIRCNAGQMQTFVYTSSAIQMEAQDENHSVHVQVRR